jgi:hypothetical protein
MRQLEIVEAMSPSELSSLIRQIGLDNVKLYADQNKLLATYSDYELIAEITDNKRRDVKGIIKKLYVSLITSDSANCDEAMAKLNEILAVL